MLIDIAYISIYQTAYFNSNPHALEMKFYNPVKFWPNKFLIEGNYQHFALRYSDFKFLELSNQ